MDKLVLDLGGGHNGYKPLPDEKVIVMDFYAKGHNYIIHNADETPYPFKEKIFDKIYASHIIEHLENTFDVLDELHRLLKDDGILIIRVPHANLGFNWSHPTHRRLYTSRSLFYLEKNTQEEYTQNLWDIYAKVFLFRYGIFGAIITSLANINKWTRHFFEKNLGIRFDEVYFELRK